MRTQIGGVSVSRETITDLEAFAGLVTKWTPKINLIAKGTVGQIWDRHIIDSAQLYQLAPPDFQKWVDLGSGGGFPGVVMAIIARECQPASSFVMIESDQRKAAFLRTAARELELPVEVLAQRIDEADPQHADVVSARALTALSGLLALVSRHLSPDGVCLLHKGKQARQEIDVAERNWSFQLEDRVSITDPEARLLAIQRITARGHEPKSQDDHHCHREPKGRRGQNDDDDQLGRRIGRDREESPPD